MNQNVRFILLIVGFVVAGALIWNFLDFGGDDETLPEPEKMQKSSLIPEEEADDDWPPVTPQKTTTPTATRKTEPGAVGRSTTPKKTDTKTPKAGTGTIKGGVKSPDKEPVSGATVKVELIDWKANEAPPEKTFTKSVTTGQDGKFELTGLPFGTYGAKASTSDAGQTKTTALSEKRPEVTVSFRIQPSGSISGVVRNEQGQGIADAVVYPDKAEKSRAGNTGGGAGSTVGRTLSDESGGFTLTNIQVKIGKLRLAAMAEGYAAGVSDFYEVGETSAEIVLSQPGTLSGLVVDSDTGDPVPAIEVKASHGESQRANAEATANEAGEFTLAGLSSGEYTVDVASEEIILAGAKPKMTVVGGEDVSGVVLNTTMGGVITGRVYDKDTDAAIPKADVSGYNEDPENRTSKKATSDSDGYYRLAGLREGNVRIMTGQIEGYPRNYDERRNVSISIGQQIDGIDFALSKGLRVAGVVLGPSGNPLNKVKVNGRIENQNYYENTETKEDGYFELAGLKPTGKFWINLTKKGFGYAQETAMSVSDGNIDDLVLTMEAESTISGKIVDANGAPQKDWRVMAQSKGKWYAGSSTSEKTNAQGEFKVEGLAPGTYQFQLLQPSGRSYTYDADRQAVQIGAQEHVTGVVLMSEAASGLTISGRITNTAGKPVERASVNAHNRSGSGSGYTNTAKDGTYTLKGLPEGSYYLSIYHHEHSQDNREGVVPGSTNVDFVLEGRGSISGQVVQASTGKPLKEFEVMQRKGEYRKFDSYMNQEFVNMYSADGTFELKSVEVGTATVYARAPGYAMTWQVVDGVQAGQNIPGVTLGLERGQVIDGIVTDISGNPISGASIYLGPVPREWERERNAATNSDKEGRFKLDSVSSETTLISAYHIDYAPASVPVQPGATSEIQIVLSFGGMVEGSVTLGGAPVAGQNVSIYYPQNRQGGSQSNTQTDENGFYQLKGLAEGEARVSVYMRDEGANQSSRSVSQAAVVADGQVTVVDFHLSSANASIEGVITLEGKAPKRASVSVRPDMSSDLQESHHSQTDANGYYRLDNLVAGPTTLMVNAQSVDGGPRITTVKVEAVSGKVVTQDIDITGGATVNGVVRGFAENEMAFVMAIEGDIPLPTELSENTMRQYEGLIRGQAMVNKEDGTFTLEGIPAGKCTILAIAFDQQQAQGGMPPSARFAKTVIDVVDNGHTNVTLSF